MRGDRALVRLYADGELIKTHPKKPPGGRSTDYDDYPDALTPYTLRDPQRLIRQGRTHGADIGRFLEQLLAGEFPWARLRQAQQLLRLGEKYGWPRLELACHRALAFEILNVRRVETILRNGLEPLELPLEGSGVRVIPLRPRFERPAESFSHLTDQEVEP